MKVQPWVKETAVALAAVTGILLALTLYTSVWPPMVVVESGSMMHEDADAYGNLGTIDPGDLVLVKAIDGRSDVELAADGGGHRYGGPGDVIVFYPGDQRLRTPIIHRAMSWVTVSDGDCTYTASDGVRRSCDGGIDEPSWGLSGYVPEASGFITKGDNNERADQASGIGIVQVHWIEGKARAELPWLGLIKLALAPGVNQPNHPADWVRVGNAYAPGDLWVMLGMTLGVLLVLPAVVDAGLDVVHRRLEGRDGPDEPGRSRDAGASEDHDASDDAPGPQAASGSSPDDGDPDDPDGSGDASDGDPDDPDGSGDASDGGPDDPRDTDDDRAA